MVTIDAWRSKTKRQRQLAVPRGVMSIRRWVEADKRAAVPCLIALRISRSRNMATPFGLGGGGRRDRLSGRRMFGRHRRVLSADPGGDLIFAPAARCAKLEGLREAPAQETVDAAPLEAELGFNLFEGDETNDGRRRFGHADNHG
jgi:hypothetical protein